MWTWAWTWRTPPLNVSGGHHGGAGHWGRWRERWVEDDFAVLFLSSSKQQTNQATSQQWIKNFWVFSCTPNNSELKNVQTPTGKTQWTTLKVTILTSGCTFICSDFTKDRMSDVTQQWGLFSLCLFLDNYICIQRVSQIFRYISIYKKCCKNMYNDIRYLLSLFLLCCTAEGSHVCVHFSKKHFLLIFCSLPLLCPWHTLNLGFGNVI